MPESPLASPQSPPVIFVAEDEEDTRLLILDTLDREEPPCQVEAYRDGEELWSRLEQNQRKGVEAPSLILLDLYMPRRNGHETLEAIRAEPSLAAIPVVLLSSSEEPSDAAAAYELGASQFAIKPTSLKDFRALVHGLVQRWVA